MLYLVHPPQTNSSASLNHLAFLPWCIFWQGPSELQPAAVPAPAATSSIEGRAAAAATGRRKKRRHSGPAAVADADAADSEGGEGDLMHVVQARPPHLKICSKTCGS